MISRMTKYSFVLLSSEAESFLDKLAEIGLVDITRSLKPTDEHSSELFQKADALKRRISWLEGEDFVRDAEYASILSEMSVWKKEATQRAPWGDFDLKEIASIESETDCRFHFYSVSAKGFSQEWAQQWPLQVISEKDGKLYFVTVAHREGYAFPLNECPRPQGTEKEALAVVAALEEKLSARAEQLRARKDEIPQMRAEYSALLSELEIYLASQTRATAADGFITTLVGFAPQDDDDRLKSAFDAMDVLYVAEDASVDDNPPIELKNNKFSRPFEVLTGMYGMPVYNEFDPTVFLSIFFLLFFSMCMGDAGYGLLLIIIGQLLKRSSGSLASMHSLVTILGVGTVVVGLVMGGFFGVSLYELGWIPDWYKQIILTGELAFADTGVQWVRGDAAVAAIPDGVTHYSLQMVLSLAIGVLHICLAMIVKSVWTVRRDGFKNSLSTLGWTLLIVGFVLSVSVGMLGVVSENVMKWMVIVVGGISALGIFFLNKWGRNPLINFGSGLWDTYSMASGLMGDVLSYIRLYALGLSGGMLGSTFNLMADMVKGSDPTWQWIPFVLVLLVGHALNLAMSCLGAFVHPLRLNFLEFFKNSGYEGRGLRYNPIKK